MKLLSILIPCYNEINLLPQVCPKLFGVKIAGVEIKYVFINDGSTDGSGQWLDKELLGKTDCRVIHLPKNTGKGAAIKQGLISVTEGYVIIFDADGEYNPDDIKTIIAEAQDNVAVYGLRNVPVGWRGYWFFILGNRCMNLVMSLVSGKRVMDAYTGYKCLPVKVWHRLNLTAQSFDLEAEITAKLLKLKIPIVYVPVGYKPRTFAQGKKIRLSDGFKGIWVFITTYFKSKY